MVWLLLTVAAFCVVGSERMERPPNCPEQLYALMRLCWRVEMEARPTFRKLSESLIDFRQTLAVTTPEEESMPARQTSFQLLCNTTAVDANEVEPETTHQEASRDGSLPRQNPFLVKPDRTTSLQYLSSGPRPTNHAERAATMKNSHSTQTLRQPVERLRFIPFQNMPSVVERTVPCESPPHLERECTQLHHSTTSLPLAPPTLLHQQTSFVVGLCEQPDLVKATMVEEERKENQEEEEENESSQPSDLARQQTRWLPAPRKSISQSDRPVFEAKAFYFDIPSPKPEIVLSPTEVCLNQASPNEKNPNGKGGSLTPSPNQPVLTKAPPLYRSINRQSPRNTPSQKGSVNKRIKSLGVEEEERASKNRDSFLSTAEGLVRRNKHLAGGRLGKMFMSACTVYT